MSNTATTAPPAKADLSADLESYYHVGLLPASGEVLFPVADESKRGRVVLKKFDAYELWNNSKDTVGEEGINLFIARARQFLGLNVRGWKTPTASVGAEVSIHFPSTNEYVEMGKKSTTRAPFPGGVAHLSGEELQAVVKACYRHILRFPNGTAKMDDPMQTVQLIDLDFGKKPEEWSEDQWSKEKIAGRALEKRERFNPKTDRYVADFVYIKKLTIADDDVDAEDYKKNPNKFHYQWVGPVTKKFYQNPPKSVAELYPQKSA